MLKYILLAISLSACVYAEGPGGQKFATINLPTQTQTTINKTVTVNAPPGTTVVVQEKAPPTVIYQDGKRRVHRKCYQDNLSKQRICEDIYSQ